jgi:hypothetical protein
LILNKVSVNIISGSLNLIEDSGRANIILPKGTKLCIDDALYSSKSRRNLISLKDIRLNGFHVETTNEGSEEYLYITSIISDQKLILEKLHTLQWRSHVALWGCMSELMLNIMLLILNSK